jgi:hypothetical protein
MFYEMRSKEKSGSKALSYYHLRAMGGLRVPADQKIVMLVTTHLCWTVKEKNKLEISVICWNLFQVGKKNKSHEM